VAQASAALKPGKNSNAPMTAKSKSTLRGTPLTPDEREVSGLLTRRGRAEFGNLLLLDQEVER
jgi:hypothetical protein